ncbi:MAG: ATP-binding protein [Clostridia bacterium]|nr:ATP-binding protein [Clostridia bacterium]
MIQSTMDRIGQYVNGYNEARNANDVENAIKYGRLAVRDAGDELKKPNLNAVHKEYYQTVISSIGVFLANPNALRAAKEGMESIGTSEDKIKTTDWFAAPIPDLGMKDIAGLRDVCDEVIVNVFAPMSPKYSGIYQKYRGEASGIRLLLYGPPGTGKTHFVRCMAGELRCKVAFVQVKDVMANLVGDGAKIIAEVFEQANKYDRCIILFDEIDAIAASREGEDSRYTKEQLTTLLTYMDGFTSKTKPGQIRIVIAATNRPWALDSAVKRGGRFDTQIYVPLPDEEARRQLIKLALGKDERVANRVDVPCAKDVTIDWLVDRTEGYAGADVQAICRQAVNRPLKREIMAMSKGNRACDCVTRKDFEEVFNGYINSITNDMLMQFDAYKMNMEYGFEYMKVKCDQILRAVYNGLELSKHERSWFKSLCASGYIEREFGEKYDLTFLKDQFQ